MPTILISDAIASLYEARIKSFHWFDEHWKIARLGLGTVLSDDVIDDITIAYLSSDVLGGSTVDFHTSEMQAFCSVLQSAKNLALLQVPSSGVDRPIYQSLAQRGVVLTTAAGAAAETVALTALTGLLALSRRLPLWVKGKQLRQWNNLRTGPQEPRELRGEKVVIVGCGKIGTQLAQMCKTFGMRTHGLRRSAAVAAPPFDQYGSVADLPSALKDADWVVAACPLTDETRGMFNKDIFACFQPHASFINVARGAVAVESDLIEALRRGQIEGAYLDVFEVEPLPKESPLWAMDNVLISPHSAGDTRGRHIRVAEIFLDNLNNWVQRSPLLNRVQ